MEILAEVKNLKGGIDELRALTQREFNKEFNREQSKVESFCPNVFALRPLESNRWTGKVFAEKIQLQLYCNAPGQWHPAEVGGVYEIERPAEWLQTMAPYIRGLVSVLKYAAPMLGPWIGVLAPEQYEKRFKGDIRLMEELVKKLPNIDLRSDTLDDPRLSAGFLDSHRQRVQGATLRALRLQLDEKDPMQHWGGLRRILTPEGHYLWLCQHHSLEFAP